LNTQKEGDFKVGRIEDLRKNLLDMSHEEKLARIRQIRAERKIIRSPVREKKMHKAKVGLIDKVRKQLSGLSKEEIKALLGG